MMHGQKNIKRYYV